MNSKVCIELGLLWILCRTSVASLTCDTNVLFCNDNIVPGNNFRSHKEMIGQKIIGQKKR